MPLAARRAKQKRSRA